MSIPAANPYHHHTLRFYIVMSTIVIGGIFFLLLINNNGDFSLTSAIIKSIGHEELPATEETELAAVDEEVVVKEESKNTATNTKQKVEEKNTEKTNTNQKTTTAKKATAQNQVDIQLTSDKVPQFTKEARFGDLTLRFADLTTTIRINNDRLEINDQEGKTKTIKMHDAVGKLNFDNEAVNLDVIATRFELNDVALSSKGEIIISFEGYQDYEFLNIENVEVEDFTIDGSGNLEINERLTYKLNKDKTTIDEFLGSITVDRESTDSENALQLIGKAKGISISGDELDLNVR